MNFIRSFLMIFYPNRKKLLQDTFLYDAPDEGYPKSLQDFYDEAIGCKPAL
jgi:hypothetical protein